MNKPVKCDESLLGQARAALIEKLAPRLARTPGRGFVEKATGGGFVDAGFVARFGPGLHRLSDAAIVNAALAVLIEHVERHPDGTCGVPMIDDAPAP